MNALQIFGTIFGVLIAVGCGNPVREAQNDPPIADPLLDRFIVYDTNSTLAKHVHLERVVRDPSANPLRVQFDVINNSSYDFDFMYKIRWFDKNAMQISNPNEVWRKESIGGKERRSLSGVGPTPRAAD